MVVLDQAIYTLVQDVVCKHQARFSRVVLRMGGFHIVMTLLAVIGKQFGNAGLQSMFGSSSCAGVLSGKHYGRAIRCHKVTMEAICSVSVGKHSKGGLISILTK